MRSIGPGLRICFHDSHLQFGGLGVSMQDAIAKMCRTIKNMTARTQEQNVIISDHEGFTVKPAETSEGQG